MEKELEKQESASPQGPSAPIELTYYKFNEEMYSKYPSISPRPPLEFKDDTKTAKAMSKFITHHPELTKFMMFVESSVISEKPDNIIEFLCDFFLEKNAARIKENLVEVDPLA